jgi:hypothetical protein
MCEDDGRLKTSATIIERLFLHDRGASSVAKNISAAISCAEESVAASISCVV